MQDTLKNWKESPKRKPLLVYGARQVGKTWLVRDFAASHYADLVDQIIYAGYWIVGSKSEPIPPGYICAQC